MARDSGGSAERAARPATSDTANEPAIAAQATAPDAALPSRRPRLAFSRKPRNGKQRNQQQHVKRNHEDTKTRSRKVFFVLS